MDFDCHSRWSSCSLPYEPRNLLGIHVRISRIQQLQPAATILQRQFRWASLVIRQLVDHGIEVKAPNCTLINGTNRKFWAENTSNRVPSYASCMERQGPTAMPVTQECHASEQRKSNALFAKNWSSTKKKKKKFTRDTTLYLRTLETIGGSHKPRHAFNGWLFRH